MLKSLLMSLLLIFSINFANAQEVSADFGGNKVTLTTKECKNPVILAMLKQEYHAQFKAGTVLFQGKSFDMCWILDPRDTTQIYLIDIEGDSGFLPIELFKPSEQRKPNPKAI